MNLTLAPLPDPMPADEMPENNPPMRLSYRVPRRVLHGGMSLVYLCDTKAGGGSWKVPVVAVKRLDAETLSIPGTARRFLRECYLWLQIGRHLTSSRRSRRTNRHRRRRCSSWSTCRTRFARLCWPALWICPQPCG